MRHSHILDRWTGNLLGALAVLLTDELDDATHRAAGRSGATAAALAVLGQEPGQGIETLRLPLGLTHSATVRLVDGLQADGCARRGRGTDGRSVSVTLTEAGRARARAVLDGRAEVLDRALATLTRDERRALTGLLERLLPALVESDQHAERICRLCDWAVCPDEACPVTHGGRAAEGAGEVFEAGEAP
jgi:DNA-binding MarR family transcriptional regulator